MSTLLRNLKRAEAARLARQRGEPERAEPEPAAAGGLEELRTRELAEAEGLAAAGARAETERAQAMQADALAAAERRLDRLDASLAALAGDEPVPAPAAGESAGEGTT